MLSMAGLPVGASSRDDEHVDMCGAERATTVPWRSSRFIPTSCGVSRAYTMPSPFVHPTARRMTSPTEVIAVHTRLLEAWNRRDAVGFAALFTPTGLAVGFDGSEMAGRAEIEGQLAAVFTHHQTAAYVAQVRGVRQVAEGAHLLHAVVGMVPPGADAINPAVNAVQSALLVADGTAAAPQLALLQTTPAAFHGRPHLGAQLTADVTAVLRSGRVVATAA
jgi:uncharacterized protein (TIGR02246 family)